MYSYTFDEETGGILLNSSPTLFSKEPRPVYASEMDLLEFDKYWKYNKQNEVPYLWTESNVYYYKGTIIAKIKGGDLYTPPEVMPQYDELGNVVLGKETCCLEPMDIAKMCEKNKDFLTILENTSVKLIVKAYEKYKNKLDIFHVAFSGGKDSAVLLDLVKKALPKGSFVVIFGDTGMEFPDTYEVVRETKKRCEDEGIPFYEAKSHFNPEESWKLFGPPARVLRWCCSVHKSTPQTLKMREITGKNDYTGLDYVGVRAHESLARSKYEVENYGKKQKGQYSYNPILEWTSAEIWLYMFANDIKINGAYKKGNSRAGCLFCPMGGGKNDYYQYNSYPAEVGKYINLVKSMNARNAGDENALCSYLSNGGWNARKNGRDLTINEEHYRDDVVKGKVVLTITKPSSEWKEWIKTMGTIPFEYSIEETVNGYKVIFDGSVQKRFPSEYKRFKQVFHKAAYCVGCKVCETNCPHGKISFENGIKISDCLHCGQCHDIPSGCLAYHSLKTSRGNSMGKKESINSFANHAPKLDWVREFFEIGDSYWGENSLNKGNQEPKLKRFFRESRVTNAENKEDFLFYYAQQVGWENETLWGLMLVNLVQNNPQFRWYVNNMETGKYYDKKTIRDLLISEDISDGDAVSITSAYKRFCDLPLGYSLNFGACDDEDLVRLKCNIVDNRVVLYALYLFVETCNMEKEFHISVLFDEEVERDGVSPVRLFGLYDEDELQSILLGLTSRYPEFINATFTNDLKTITLYDKTSADVLELFKEEF